MIRLSIFQTHPIQYLAPVWRCIAADPEIELKVHYFSDVSVRGGLDPEFGVPVAWDVPLLEGYASEFLERDAERTGFRQTHVADLAARLEADRTDCVLVGGYMHPFERQVVRTARQQGIRTLLRGELTDAPRPGRRLWKRVARSVFLKRFYRQVEAFCVLGENGREHLVRRGIPAEDIFFSPHSIDTGHFEAQAQAWSRAAARADLGLPADATVLLFSGKLIPRKQLLLLAHALELMDDVSRLHLLVLGDGPQMPEVRRALEGTLGDRAVLPGFVNQGEMGRYFAAADVLVLPSDFETWGLVVNEAMTMGLPVITSSAVGCHGDLVVPGKTGYVFPAGKPEALAACLEVVSGAEAHLREMGRAARHRIRQYATDVSARGIVRAAAGACADSGSRRLVNA